MDNLERLSQSVAQVELLVAGLRRENHDLARRLAGDAASLRVLKDSHHAEVDQVRRDLEAAALALRQDPGLEARAHQAELESADLARQLDEIKRSRLEEKTALEAEIARLQAEVLTARLEDQVPVADPMELAQARAAKAAAEAETQGLRGRLDALESEARQARGEAESAREAEAQARQALAAHQARLADTEKRVTALEAAASGAEQQLSEANLKLAESAKPEEVAAWQARLAELEAFARRAAEIDEKSGVLERDKEEVKKQKKDLAAWARERDAIRKRVEELVATLENVRLG